MQSDLSKASTNLRWRFSSHRVLQRLTRIIVHRVDTAKCDLMVMRCVENEIHVFPLTVFSASKVRLEERKNEVH